MTKGLTIKMLMIKLHIFYHLKCFKIKIEYDKQSVNRKKILNKVLYRPILNLYSKEIQFQFLT